MANIHSQVVAAFHYGYGLEQVCSPWTIRTMILEDDTLAQVLRHNHTIHAVKLETGRMYATFAGRVTHTCAHMLRAVGFKASIRDGKPMVAKQDADPHGWYTFDDDGKPVPSYNPLETRT